MSSFWDFESRQERLRRDADTWSRRARVQAFTQGVRDSLQARGMGPDLVPSLNQDLDLETPTMTRREAGARAQSLGVTVEQYRAATPQQRRAAASAIGRQYERRQELRDQGYTNEQIGAWDRINRRAQELIPEYPEEPPEEGWYTVKENGKKRQVPITQAFAASEEEKYQWAMEQAIGELGWNEVKELSRGGGILESFGRLMGQIEALDPVLAGPLARTTEGYPVPDPEGRTAFERGTELSRPVARPVLAGIAEPFEQVEEVTGVPTGGITGKITGDVSEDILAEVINPAALVLIAPLAGQGIRAGMSARMVAAKMVSNLLGTGMEPEMVRGTLRGATAVAKGGPRAAANLPRNVKASLDALGGFTQRARARPLRGGPPSPTFQEFQRHTDEMLGTVERADKSAKYIREEVAAGRMDTRAMDEATVRLSDARSNLRTAKTDLNTARYQGARGEIVEVVRATGADEDVARMIGDAFDHSVARVPAEEFLMNAGATRHWLANAAAHITGTPPGVVGRLAHHRDILLGGLRRYSVEVVHPAFKDLQRGLRAELGSVRFTGPKKWSQLAEGEYKAHHIIQHPEWFEGMSPGLRAQMDKAQELMRTRLETAKALGYPIEALDAAYLEQLWEIPSQAIGAAYLPGRVSVAKPKLFDDYFRGLTQGYTPLPMSVEELMQHSTGLLDQAISDAWMKQEVVRRFGAKHPGKVVAGKVRFQHALYKDWHGPAEISSWLDEMEAPVGKRLRQASNVSAAFRGTVFGLTDIAVAGVQFPLSVAHGGLQVGVGTLNRSLQQLGLPYMHLYLQDEKFLGRAAQAASDGLHIGIGPASVRLGGGTVAKYIPGMKQVVEPVLNKAIDFATQVQFGHALTSVRLRMYEGNLIALKMTGRDITDKAVRQLAAEWANSATGASRGPMIKGRRAVESVALTSVQMTRANLSVYGQLAKTVGGIATGKVSKMEGLRAALTLANLGAYTYGVQYLFNEVFGDGPMEWVPGRSAWATIRIGGRTVPIMPQRSILRAVDKSIKILAEEVGATDTDRYSIQDVLMAWSQVAVGKASPLAGIPLAAAGIGFEPGTGRFQLGEMTPEGRLVSMAPVPPLLEQAGWQERDELSLAIAGLGFNPYATSSGVLLREEFKAKTDEELNWESPAHREVIEQSPRLDRLWEKSRAESREYGSEAAITSEEVRQEIADGEEDKGIVRLAEAILSGDPFASANWTERRSEFLIWRSGKWDMRLTGKEPRTEIGKLVNKYYEIDPMSEEYTDPSGMTNWAKFKRDRDVVLDQMPQADADAIRDKEKFSSEVAERVDKQFREATDKLRPFWDLEDEVWSRLRAAHDILRPYASLEELEKAKADELVKQGFPQEEARWRLNRVPVVAEVRSVVSQERFNYRLRHPEVDALLVKWYGNTPAREQEVSTGRPRRPTRPSRAR